MARRLRRAVRAVTPSGQAARPVHDLPEPPPLAGAAPVQYGPRLTARGVCLSVAQLVPVQRRCQTLVDLFGVQLSQGTLAGRVTRVGARFIGPALPIRDAVAARDKRLFRKV